MEHSTMTATPITRRTHPWRFPLVAALAAVALLGAACSGALAGGDDAVRNGDGDTPASGGSAMPVPSDDGGSDVPDIVVGDDPGYPVKTVPAPIDELDLAVMESYPPQYLLRIVSGLPSGCAEFSHSDVERDGDTIKVTIWNTVPADDTVPCTMIYGMHESSVNLGSDFESGSEYTVYVNDQRITFTAQ